MQFSDFSNKAKCPYNPNHIFDKSKYIFHLNECKDKEKVKHLYASCQYNKLHILKKEDIETHELICEDRDEIKKLTEKLKNTMLICERERQRSRDKVKAESQSHNSKLKGEVKQQNQEEPIGIDECPLCQKVLANLPTIKQIGSESLRQKVAKVEKLLKVSKQMDKMRVKIES